MITNNEFWMAFRATSRLICIPVYNGNPRKTLLFRNSVLLFIYEEVRNFGGFSIT